MVDMSFAQRKLFILILISSIEINPDLVFRFTIAAYNGDVSAAIWLLEVGIPVGCVDGHSHTALARAAANNQTDVIHELLQRGADVNERGVSGFTALYWSTLNNKTGVIRILLEYGASTTIKDDRSRPP